MTEQEIQYYLKKYKCKSRIKRVDKIGNPIEMRMTFQEWLQVWIDSGHIEDLGCRKHQYVMCRKNDIGHYEIGNVFIDHTLNNVIAGIGTLTDNDRKINALVLKTGYSRRTVRALIKKGKILLEAE